MFLMWWWGAGRGAGQGAKDLHEGEGNYGGDSRAATERSQGTVEAVWGGVT